MKHVVATNVSMITGIKIKELGRVAFPGEEFDVSESRFIVLSGNNMYHKVFAILAESKHTNAEPVEEIQVDESIIEEIEEEPKKKRRKSNNV